MKKIVKINSDGVETTKSIDDSELMDMSLDVVYSSSNPFEVDPWTGEHKDKGGWI